MKLEKEEKEEFLDHYFKLVQTGECDDNPWYPKLWDEDKCTRFCRWYMPIFHERISVCQGHQLEKNHCAMTCLECGGGYCHCLFPYKKHCCCRSTYPIDSKTRTLITNLFPKSKRTLLNKKKTRKRKKEAQMRKKIRRRMRK